MARLRTPFLIVAVVMLGLALLVELASPLAVGGDSSGTQVRESVSDLGDDRVDPAAVSGTEEPPGRGIASLAVVDGILLFRVGLMALAMVVPARVLGRVQGIGSIVVGLVVAVASLVLLLFLVVELTVKVGLFLSPPFGTVAYLAVWGAFPHGDAEVLLGLILVLKLVALCCLPLAHQRFLQVKSLMLLVGTSVVLTLVLAFLHGLVPNPVTSIADQVGAIVFVIVGLIWAVLTLVGAIPGLIRALRVDRALQR